MPADRAPAKTTSGATPGEWSLPVILADLPAHGRVFTLEADADARTAIAARLNAPAVDHLRAQLTLTPAPQGVTVKGAVSAALRRTCIASLEPFVERIEEEIDVTFSKNAILRQEGDDLLFDPSDSELLEGDTLDLADFAVQQAALAMNPYPRSPEARSLADEFGKSDESSPFSVLKTMQDAVSDKGGS